MAKGEHVGVQQMKPGHVGPPSTRELLLQVTQQEISEHGFNGVSLRSIARRADVDPSLVRHYFGSKQNLLAHAVRNEIDPRELAEEVLRGTPRAVGRRVVKALLGYWDDPGTAPMLLAQLSATLNSETAARGAVDDFLLTFLGAVADAVSPDHPELRASLAASQVVALAFSRYLIKDPVLAASGQQETVRIVGRTVQHYLTGPLPVDATGGGSPRATGARGDQYPSPNRLLDRLTLAISRSISSSSERSSYCASVSPCGRSSRAGGSPGALWQAGRGAAAEASFADSSR
jgi:AcrR family transcriptional regulator